MPDKSISANALIGECGIEERCDPAGIVQWSIVMMQQDVSYLSVLLHLGHKEWF
jgi:hypothetical protein